MQTCKELKVRNAEEVVKDSEKWRHSVAIAIA